MPDCQAEFERIVEATDRTLWAAYLVSIGKSQPSAGVQIRFPRRRQGTATKVRVSEQEARFVLTGELATSSLLYSIETPTSQPYQFTGTQRVSGQTDVTVYAPNGEAMWKVEFKAHGFSEDRKVKAATQKDIEKLLCESTAGFWFHTFEGVDNSTLSLVWRAFVSDVRHGAHQRLQRIQNKMLVFHACVLRQQFSVEQTLVIDPSHPETGCVSDVPGPCYSITRSGLKSSQETNGWKLHRQSLTGW